MDILSFKNLSFQYKNNDLFVLNNINLSVKKGSFNLICGRSGYGKSTLLRHFKPSLMPSGNCFGDIIRNTSDIKTGYVFQNPESQTVMESVFDELVFGLSNLGLSTFAIDLKLGETTAFLGIEDLLDKKISTLSGGQKQLVNLAAILMMEPEVIIFDEPISQLDPVCSTAFLQLLKRLYDELGITIIICEHTLDDILPMSTDVFYFSAPGHITHFNGPNDFIKYIKENDSSFMHGMPSLVNYINTFDKLHNTHTDIYPLTVSGARNMFAKEDFSKSMLDTAFFSYLDNNSPVTSSENAVLLKNIYFRYEKKSNDILKGISLKVKKGSIFALIGGNGSGKSTLLSNISGYLKPYKGKVKLYGSIAYLPQNPLFSFVSDVIYDDFMLSCRKNGLDKDEIFKVFNEYEDFNELSNLLYKNPLDLSGGQLQLMALFKLILRKPDILLLDEPTKGLDGFHKAALKRLLLKLSRQGTTIILISHDLCFVSKTCSHTCMLFNGRLCSDGTPFEVLNSNHFYTTPVFRALK